MYIDLTIILTYFVVIMIIGIWSRVKSDVGVDEYFLSSRSLKWPYIAVSTIATNIHPDYARQYWFSRCLWLLHPFGIY